jgi:GNAT superfamily N-acetyltransferase
MTAAPSGLDVRAVAPDDRAALLELLASSLDWVPNELFDRFFEWKHVENPFGRSPAWVAVEAGRLVGFRTFLRWELEDPTGRVHRAVRAVDTATHPDHRGRGVFRELTMHALDRVREESVELVFNTPNDKSRPGYLSMGWQEVGRVATALRATRPGAVTRMLRSRVPAERWSLPATAGSPALEILTDSRISTLLARLAPPGGLRTPRSPQYLRWRYGFEPLRYRVIALEQDPSDGVAVFRLRRRGSAIEAALCDVLVPEGDTSRERALVSEVARTSGADYVIRVGASPGDIRAGFVHVPRIGPVLTWRHVTLEAGDVPHLRDLDLALGDIELF